MGKTAFKFVEMIYVGKKLADDEHRPTVGENFRRPGHRTVLSITVHVLSVAGIDIQGSSYSELDPLLQKRERAAADSRSAARREEAGSRPRPQVTRRTHDKQRSNRSSRAANDAISVRTRQQKERCVTRIQSRLLLVTVLVAVVFAQVPPAVAQQTGATGTAPAGGDAATVWNANAGVAATKACIAPIDDPFHESRIYAMMHVAIHDALNAIDRRFRPYTFDKQAEPHTSMRSTAALVLTPSIAGEPALLRTPRLPRRHEMSWSRSSVNSLSSSSRSLASMQALQASKPPIQRPLAAIPNTPAKAQGIAVGQAAAAAILALRAADGAVGPFLNFSCPQAQSRQVSMHTRIPGHRL